MAAMRILIVGGGIAGLTLAALLRQRGLEPVVIEKAVDYGDVGYVLSLWPMGNRVLRGLGLSERFHATGSRFAHWTLCDPNSRLLRSFDANRWMSRYGETRMLLRSELLALLRSTGSGVPVRMGTTVTRLWQEGAQVQVTFSDATQEEFDLVVGADGIHSSVRKLLFGDRPLHQSGYVWWGWWYDPGIRSDEEVSEFWGTDRLFGLYPVPGRVACAAVLPRVSVPEPIAERRRHIRQALANFKVVLVQRCLDELERIEPIEAADLADIRVKDWAKGRVVLLGDAAAGFLPSAGIGASVAMESAAVLSDELSRADATHIPEAIQFYIARRRKRVDAIQSVSRELLWAMLPGKRIFGAARNLFVRHLPEARFFEPLGRWMDRPA